MNSPSLPRKASLVFALAAGGTGGHMFPAFATAEALKELGHQVHLFTDQRGERYLGAYKGEASHLIASSTLKGRTPGAIINMIRQNAKGFFQSYGLIRVIRPDVMIGFGGYPSLPPVLAARFRNIPIILQEQNAVLGRANRLLAYCADKLALAMPEVAGCESIAPAKLVTTGLPLRQDVLNHIGIPYPPLAPSDDLRLLVYGGSQGAEILTQIVPCALEALPEPLRQRLHLTQQVKADEQAPMAKTYEAMGVRVTMAELFTNLPELMAQSHLVIARAGAATVAELGAIGRPAILVPYARSLDQDQNHNARQLAKTGGTDVIEERDLTPERLRDALCDCFSDPLQLKERASKQSTFGKPDAASNLATLALTLIESRFSSC